MRLYAVAAETDIVKTALDMEIDGYPAVLIPDRHGCMAQRASWLRRIAGFHFVGVELFYGAFFMTEETGISTIPRFSATDKAVVAAPITRMGIQALICKIMAGRANDLTVFERRLMIIGNCDGARAQA